MEIRILGALEVTVGGDSRLPGGARERALLTVMALAPGQVLSADRLIDDLWGEELPGNPTNALQAVVSRLRRSLGTDAIRTQSPGYVLDVEPDAVDAGRFRTLVAAAGAEDDPAQRRRRYEEALALWRGPALADFVMEEFAQREIAALEELRLHAIEGRIAAALDAGGGAELVAELEQLVAAHPLRESLRASQMRALYRAGRQADSLRAYAAARRVLGEELGIEPGPDLQALEQAILEQDPRLGITAGASPSAGGLPARLASFVGRTAEIVEVRAALTQSRLVTLTGAGGAGKTSLAIEVARQLQPDYRDGVWLVELAPISTPDRVPDALMAAMHLELGGTLVRTGDVNPMDAVVEYVRQRAVLLIVDNCEHVVDAAAAVLGSLLLACPQVEILATSRERLGIPGELLWRVPPLAIDAGTGRADAVSLFLDRAHAVNPAFDPVGEELAAVVEICRKVEGLPLAIELAAARTRSLPVHEIASRLRTGIEVLSGGPRHGSARQRTLESTIDWSYRLLREEDRELFARLSAFQSSFSLRAAEAAAPAGWTSSAVLESVERLIDASIISPVRGTSSLRFRLLDTLRVFAAERLAEAGATDDVMRRLLAHFLESMAPAEDGLRGPDQLDWLDRVETDLATVRSVLDWAVGHAPAHGLRLAAMLGWFWYLRGAGQEARERLGRLLQAAGDTADGHARAHARFFHALHDPHIEAAAADFRAAHDGYVASGDTRGVVHSLALMAAWGLDRAETQRLIDEAATLCVDSGYAWGSALISFLRAGAAAVANEIAASAEYAEDAADRFAALGDRWGEAYSLYSLGVARRALGDYAGAREALLGALEHARPMRLRREMAPVLAELASIAMMQDELAAARDLLAQAREYADDVPFAGSQGMVRNAQGRLARLMGEYEEAQRLHREAIELYAASSLPGGLAYSYSCLGFADEWRGDLEAARRHHREALHHARVFGDAFAIALGLEGVGAAAIVSGDVVRGVTLIHAGLALRTRTGTPLPPGERLETERALATASRAVGADKLDAAAAAGAQLSVDEAIALAEEAALR